MVSGDLSATILIRALHLVASFLECRIFVRHVPRQSSLASIMADSLTRSSTAKAEVWAPVVGAQQHEQPKPLWEWLSAQTHCRTGTWDSSLLPGSERTFRVNKVFCLIPILPYFL